MDQDDGIALARTAVVHLPVTDGDEATSYGR